MPGSTIDDILERLHTLQNELEREIDQLLTEKRKQFNYTLEQGRVRFEKGMRALQKSQKTGLWAYLRDAPLTHVLSAPVIYALFASFVLLDLSVTMYQHICFRIYRIPLVSRKDYIIIDRQHLAYLNAIEKLNCIYCGYTNGLIAYVREVAARTEQYWCPIKHTRRTRDQHRYMQNYADYGDAENYQARLVKLRAELSQLQQQANHAVSTQNDDRKQR